MKRYDEIILRIRVVKNEFLSSLLDNGVLGQYEQGEAKGPVITCMADPAVLAHELGHFLESLYSFPASCNLPEKLEDATRAVWREHSKSERGHSA